LVVVAAAGFLISRSTPSRAAASEAVSTSRVTTTTQELDVGPFAGTWYHHGAELIVYQGGWGTFNWRTYADCGTAPPPCDGLIDNDIVPGGYAVFGLHAPKGPAISGQVFETGDPRVVPIGAVSIRYDQANDMVLVAFSDGSQLAMCGPKARIPAAAQC
jgi:hypothetical protein